MRNPDTSESRQGGTRAGGPFTAIALIAVTGLIATIAPGAAPPAGAIELRFGQVEGTLDTTVQTGFSIRAEGRDPAIVAQTNGGTAFSAGYDDGNLNYDQWDIVSLNAKVLHEAELAWGNYSFFGRLYYFQDWAVTRFEPEFRAFTDTARKHAGRNIIPLDYYLTADYQVFDRPLSIRVGSQVLNWGESTFIQNGLNSINPVDVSLLRMAGAALREALIPIPMVSVNADLTSNLSVECFYQFYWDNTEIEPVGTYFSTTDLGGPGATRAMLGFGLAPPDGPTDNPVQPVGTAPPIGSWIPRSLDRRPEHTGQFGVALRYLATWLYGTEIGLYWEHIHSRRPVLCGYTGDAPPEGFIDQLIWGLVNGDYASTGNYFREFPEDIDILGMSFNAMAPFGMALQGEVSSRLGQPLQIDDNEFLMHAMAPLDDVLARLATIQNILDGMSPGEALVEPPIFGNNQVSQLYGVPGFNEYLRGYERKDVLQAQMTLTKLFGPTFGADAIALLCEAGMNYVFDMESKEVLRYEAPATDMSANPWFTEAGLQPYTEDIGRFADDFSAGYRLAAVFTFNNAIGAVGLEPVIAWYHDVEGTTPSPLSNFIEGNKVVTLAVTAEYLKRITGTLSYTMYFGGGNSNLLHDRDFLSLSFNVPF